MAARTGRPASTGLCPRQVLAGPKSSIRFVRRSTISFDVSMAITVPLSPTASLIGFTIYPVLAPMSATVAPDCSRSTTIAAEVASYAWFYPSRRIFSIFRPFASSSTNLSRYLTC